MHPIESELKSAQVTSAFALHAPLLAPDEIQVHFDVAVDMSYSALLPVHPIESELKSAQVTSAFVLHSAVWRLKQLGAKVFGAFPWPPPWSGACGLAAAGNGTRQ